MKKRILERKRRMEKVKRRWIHFRKNHADFRLSDMIVMMMERFYNVHIIKIVSGEKQINIPENSTENTQRLHVGDSLYLLGAKERFDSFNNHANFRTFLTEEAPPVTLRHFLENQEQEKQPLLCFSINIQHSGLVGKSIKDAGIHKKWNCMVIGLQRDIYPMVSPDVQTVISNGDKIWVLGSQRMFQKLVQSGLLEINEETVDRDIQ
jgi:CPA2 family monovalent cation:H+ antiporter-2